LHESDGDWHIELTDAATTPVTSCIIAEIPAETYGVIYRRARCALAALVDTTKLSPSGDVDPPLRVQLTGAAFYDGYHQKQPIGALPRGLEAGELVPRVAHRPREAVRHVLERRDRSPRRPIERASPEAAQLALKTPKTAVEHLLCHRIPDLEREPQLAGESGIRDVYSWIQLDSQRLRVRLPPHAQPHLILAG